MLKKLCILLCLIWTLMMFSGCEEYPSVSVQGPSGQNQQTNSEHVHSYQGSNIAPTCTEEGYMIHICDCGHSFQDSEVPALGHSWGKWETVTMATQTQAGLQSRLCSRCAIEENQILEKLEPNHIHDYTPILVASTCTEAGFYAYRCRCGDEYREENQEPLGHSWSDWQPGETGQIRACVRCGARDTVQDSHVHDYTVQTVEPSCTEGGYRLTICACGESSREILSDPLGHSWSQWRLIEAPTTESEGQAQRSCQVCGESQREAVQKFAQDDNVIIVYISKTVASEDKLILCIMGVPGVEYGAMVFSISDAATAQSLGSVVADEEGYATWQWYVEEAVAPGVYEIVIIGKGLTQAVRFAVLPGD